MSTFPYRGKTWFYRLVSKKNPMYKGRKKRSLALMDRFPREQLTDQLVVRMTTADGQFLYTLFDNYVDFYNYSLQLPPEHRRFYEVALGERSQKPHFDLDITLPSKNAPIQEHISSDQSIPDINPETLVSDLIDCAYQLLYPYNVRLSLESDVLIYTSHGQTEKNGKLFEKQSYHIIFNNYCHGSNVEAKAFYDKVMLKLKVIYPNLPPEWVDPKVYSPTQNFRMIGSTKQNCYRPKIFCPRWKFRGQDVIYQYKEKGIDEHHQALIEVSDSLLGHCAGCQMLPNFAPKIERGLYVGGSKLDDIPEAVAKAALQLLAAAIGKGVRDRDFPFELLSVAGPVASLKRLLPTMCSMCERVHEAENPYLLVLPSRKVYFYCRRNDEKRLFIGLLQETWSTNKKGADGDEQQLRLLEDANLVVPHHDANFHASIISAYLKSESALRENRGDVPSQSQLESETTSRTETIIPTNDLSAPDSTLSERSTSNPAEITYEPPTHSDATITLPNVTLNSSSTLHSSNTSSPVEALLCLNSCYVKAPPQLKYNNQLNLPVELQQHHTNSMITQMLSEPW